jgi:hypothetical protein
VSLVLVFQGLERGDINSIVTGLGMGLGGVIPGVYD